MFQAIDLRELAQMQGPERAFLSLYASGPEALKTLNAREGRIRQLLEDEPTELEYFEENLKLVRQVLEENRVRAPGLAVFACWALNFVRGYPLTVEVPDLVWVGAAPYLRPLAELQDEYENFLIVAADNKSTRIMSVTSAVANEADQVKGGVKNHVRKGGWSQQRYERRRDNQLHHYAKEVSEVLDKLCRNGRVDRVVLLGSRETMDELERVLPSQVAEKVVGKKPMDLHAGDDEIIDRGYELYFEEERQSETRLWDRIQNMYLQGGPAAVGPSDVLDAVRQGRIEQMVVTRDAKLLGTQCRDCEATTADPVERCPQCNSESVFPIDLINELVRQLKLTSAEPEFVDADPKLARVGHVAALLRY